MDEPFVGEAIWQMWAKSDPLHPLPGHLIDVGHVALLLLDRSPVQATVSRFVKATGCPEASAPAWLAYLVAMHDLGKCHPCFQAKDLGLAEPLQQFDLACDHWREEAKGFRHEAVSARWLQEHLRDTCGWTRTSALTAADAIRGHHGSFKVDMGRVIANADAERWEPPRRALEQVVRSVFAPPPWQADFADHSVAGVLMAGLTVLSDWIASNPDLFDMRWEGEPAGEYAELSRQRALVALQRLGLYGDVPFSLPLSFRAAWPDIKEPRKVQESCEQLAASGLPPGLTIVEAPMGEGKTEAALYLAAHFMASGEAGGIYVALPTAATSNQLFGRYREFLAQHDPGAVEGVRLVHGTSWLVDAATPSREPAVDDTADHRAGIRALDWFRPSKRGMQSRHGVGTVDQAEKAVMLVRHGFLRLFGLAGKVLVIDEVHAYDPYMTAIISRLLEWCRALSTPVILLSATLPEARRLALAQSYCPGVQWRSPVDGDPAPYPLVTHVCPEGAVQLLPVTQDNRRQTSVGVRLHKGLLGDAAAVARVVAERAGRDGCLCVIANTVNSAQHIFRELERLLPQEGPESVKLLLFHARFPLGGRQDIEAETLRCFDKRSLLPATDSQRTERPRRAVLVATQVVEQSLDLDFDEMFSEIAPIDLLLQRCGRLHRHQRPRTGSPVLHLILPPEGSVEFGASSKVYHPYVLLRTLALLQPGCEWQLPQQMRQLVEGAYGAKEEAPCGMQQALRVARENWEAQTRADAAKARPALIPAPAATAFTLADAQSEQFDDEEGPATSYFAAKTRLEEQETVQILLAEAGEFAAELAGRRAPGRDRLQVLYRQMVTVPRWWLLDVVPAEGFVPPEPAPPWLPGVTVLRVVQRRWQGLTSNGVRVVISAHPVYGLLREEERA